MRHRFLLGQLAVVVVLGGLLVDRSLAQLPHLRDDFRLLPRHSTLEVTGGFAGVDERYQLGGTFGLVTGYEDGVSCLAIGCPPPQRPFAQFVDVRAFAVERHAPSLAHRIPLKRFVDLEQLEGTFHHGHPERLFFTGFDGQHQPFGLTATRHGRLLHLAGASVEQCCDFFQYKIDAWAHLAPHGDFNHDGVVDAADYTVLRDSLHADALRHADYDEWRHSFGATAEAAFESGVAFGELAAVPEPTTLAVMAAGLLGGMLVRRRGLGHPARLAATMPRSCT